MEPMSIMTDFFKSHKIIRCDCHNLQIFTTGEPNHFKRMAIDCQIILKGCQLNAKSSIISYTLVWLTNIRGNWESRQCLDLRRTANTPIRTSSLNKSNGSPVARRAVNVAPGGDPAMYSHTFTNKVDLFSTAVFIEAKRKGINSTT